MATTPDRLYQVFIDALRRPVSDRSAYLDSVCRDDDDLRRRLDALLAAHDREADEGRLSLRLAHLSIQEHDPLVGTTLGRYRIQERIGSGGAGNVYLATRVDDLHLRVALKTLRTGTCSDNLLRRFRNEWRLLARLRHENIARFLDAAVTDEGIPYFVMEYIEGEPLTDYCRNHGRTVKARLELMRAICSAVQYAHRHLVLHRDIKPSNIMVAADGQPMLLDFGVAKVLTPSSDGLEPLAEARALTPAYASPEQLREAPTDARADVYSLGVVLYELLTGYRPSIRSSRDGYAHGDATGVFPPSPSTMLSGKASAATSPEHTVLIRVEGGLEPLRHRLRGDVDAIVLKCLAEASEARYPSAQAIADDIDSHLYHRPVTARRRTWRYRASRAMRRQWRMLLVGVVVACAFAQEFIRTLNAARAADEQRAITTTLSAFIYDDLFASSSSSSHGRYITLEQLLDRASATVGRRYNAHPMVKITIHMALGNAYLGLERWDSSRMHLVEALRVAQKHYGADHLYVLTSRTQLAVLDARMGNAQAALDALTGIRDARARALGDNHDMTLNCDLNIGSCLIVLKRYAEAEAQYLGLLERCRSIGPNADVTARDIKHNLVNIYFSQDRPDEARVLLLALLNEYLSNSGPTTMQSLNTMKRLVDAYMLLGQHDAARRMSEQLIALANNAWGTTHTLSVEAVMKHARVLFHVGQAETACDLLLKTIRSCDEQLGRVHGRTITVIREVAETLLRQQQPGVAEQVLADFGERLADMYGDDSAQAFSAKETLAHAIALQGRYGEAETLLLEVIRERQHQTVSGMAHTMRARDLLSRVYLAQGHSGAAERVLSSMLESEYDEEPWKGFSKASVLLRYGWCLLQKGDMQRAENTLLCAWGIRGEDTPRDKRIACKIAVCLEELYARRGDEERTETWGVRSGECETRKGEYVPSEYGEPPHVIRDSEYGAIWLLRCNAA